MVPLVVRPGTDLGVGAEDAFRPVEEGEPLQTAKGNGRLIDPVAQFAVGGSILHLGRRRRAWLSTTSAPAVAEAAADQHPADEAGGQQ